MEDETVNLEAQDQSKPRARPGQGRDRARTRTRPGQDPDRTRTGSNGVKVPTARAVPNPRWDWAPQKGQSHKSQVGLGQHVGFRKKYEIKDSYIYG